VDFASLEMRRILVIGFPILLMTLLAVWRRLLHKDNSATSATLRRRSE
jgi:hypothetical protein